MGIPSNTGQWGQTSVVNILNNEVYLGKIRWRREPVKRVVEDGMVKKKRYLNNNYDLYDGLHEPIITQEAWDKVKEVQQNKDHPSNHASRELRNPFASILVCEECGAIMQRKVPSMKNKTKTWYRCPTRGCGCSVIKCIDVENAILDAMREWLADYRIEAESGNSTSAEQIDVTLDAVIGQLTQLQTQQNSLCEYLEKGIYTVEMFTRRNTILQNDIQKLQETKAELEKKQSEQNSMSQSALEIIPTTQHILDNYDALSPAQKNVLWKLVLKKVSVYRSGPKRPFQVKIYPNLPQ